MDISSILKSSGRNDLDSKIVECAEADSNPSDISEGEIASCAQALGKGFKPEAMKKLTVGFKSYLAFRGAFFGGTIKDYRFLEKFVPEGFGHLLVATMGSDYEQASSLIATIMKKGIPEEELVGRVWDLACPSTEKKTPVASASMDKVTTEDIVKYFCSGEKIVRMCAIEALICIGGDPKALIPLFDDPVESIRWSAIRAYGKLKGDPKALVPLFLDIIWMVQNAAVGVYSELKGDPKALIPLFKSHHLEAFRRAVIRAFVKLKGDPKELIPLFKDWDFAIRKVAVLAFGELKGDPKALIPLYDDPVEEVRNAAIKVYKALMGE